MTIRIHAEAYVTEAMTCGNRKQKARVQFYIHFAFVYVC